MKKIFQLMTVALMGSLSFLSCQEIEEAPDTRPVMTQAPTVSDITASSALIKASCYSFTRYEQFEIVVSERQDMSDAMTSAAKSDGVRFYNLKANTTYYVQSRMVYICRDDEQEYTYTSPIAEFRTKDYDPTRYVIYPENLPLKGYYGVFTVDGNGESKSERLSGSYEMRPSTMVTSESKVYVTAPYISDAKDPKSVALTTGEDFYYGSGSVSAANPSVKMSLKRFNVNVSLYITFIATKEEVYNLELDEVTVANVKGDSPLCSKGTLDLTTGKFTPAQNAGATYNHYPKQSLKTQSSYSHTFNGLFPVSFGDNEVKVTVKLSGDVKEKEVSLPIPASTWSEGSDVTVKMTAEYTADSVELTVTGVEVKPWEEGSTGNIDITK